MSIIPRLTRILALSVFVGGLGVAAAQAAPLYGADYGSSGNLFVIDTTTGSASVTANIGTSIGDLTSDTRPGSATVWGVDLTANALATFDPDTGSATSTVAITNADITSIAFDVVTGTLFGNDTLSFGSSRNLYMIDTMTGAATLIGDIGYDNVFALAFDQSGNLFGVDQSTDGFISIDTSTGAGGLITTGLFSGAFDMASDPDSGTMFLTNAFGQELHTIDTATGLTTLVGPYNQSSNIAGLAFGAAVVPVPAALPLMLLSLASLGMARQRRRAA